MTVEIKNEREISPVEAPINIVTDCLNRAHATLDLIYVMTIFSDQQELLLTTLDYKTLSYALSSAKRWIEQATEAAEKWHEDQRSQSSPGAGVQS